MSETLTAARVPVDGPLPLAPRFSLTTVATETPDALTALNRGGGIVVPYPAAMPDANDPCADGSARDKLIPDPIDIPPAFPAPMVYLGDICTAYGIGPWDAWKARSNIALTARTSFALEAQLAGAVYAAGPSLNDSDVDIVGGGAVSAASAVAYLEDAIADTGIDGVLHLPKPVVSYLGAAFFTNAGGVLRTAAGTPVIAGNGYPGAPNEDTGAPTIFPSGAAAAAAGQSWCYATGPVLYAVDSVIFNQPDTIAEALDRDDNTVVYRAERTIWVAWDKLLQTAVLADWTP